MIKRINLVLLILTQIIFLQSSYSVLPEEILFELQPLAPVSSSFNTKNRIITSLNVLLESAKSDPSTFLLSAPSSIATLERLIADKEIKKARPSYDHLKARLQEIKDIFIGFQKASAQQAQDEASRSEIIRIIEQQRADAEAARLDESRRREERQRAEVAAELRRREEQLRAEAARLDELRRREAEAVAREDDAGLVRGIAASLEQEWGVILERARSARQVVQECVGRGAHIEDRTMVVMDTYPTRLALKIPGTDQLSPTQFELTSQATIHWNHPVYSAGSACGRELITLNPQDPAEKEILDNIVNLIRGSLPRGISTLDKLRDVIDFINSNVFLRQQGHTQDIVQEQEAVTEKFKIEYPSETVGARAILLRGAAMGSNPIVPLTYYMRHGRGVCRHHALLSAYLIEQLKADLGLSSNTTSHMVRNSFLPGGAHAWNLIVQPATAAQAAVLYHYDSMQEKAYTISLPALDFADPNYFTEALRLNPEISSGYRENAEIVLRKNIMAYLEQLLK